MVFEEIERPLPLVLILIAMDRFRAHAALDELIFEALDAVLCAPEDKDARKIGLAEKLMEDIKLVPHADAHYVLIDALRGIARFHRYRHRPAKEILYRSARLPATS